MVKNPDPQYNLCVTTLCLNLFLTATYYYNLKANYSFLFVIIVHKRKKKKYLNLNTLGGGSKNFGDKAINSDLLINQK